jgi:hypothetical protein
MSLLFISLWQRRPNIPTGPVTYAAHFMTTAVAQVDQMDECMLAGQPKLSERVLDIHLGLYALHLERWLSYFAPEQLLIWSTKAFKEAPWHHMQQLAQWLGLDPSKSKQRGDFLKMHKRSYPDASLPKGFVQELAEFYQPHNERLFALLEERGYSAVAAQLRAAWPQEVAATIDKLEQQQLHLQQDVLVEQ